LKSLLGETLKGIFTINHIHIPLVYMKDAIDWSVFHEPPKDLYHNYTYQGGGPNITVTTMVKVLLRQSMFNMVDEQA
jgi:hypothetical protein